MDTAEDHQQLILLEASLRQAGAIGREAVMTPPFEAFISASDNPVMSFATPNTDVADWSQALITLQELFAARGRSARLEYFHELHPTLAPALEAAGFEQESAAPVMTLTANALFPRPTPSVSSYNRLSVNKLEQLKVFLEQQTLAYGGTGGDALTWLPQLTDGLKAGTILAAGLVEDGDFVSGAVIQIGGDVGELAGVWTRPEMRRRGLAFDVCQQLLANYFAEGFELCWLSAAQGAEKVYGRLGFERVGTQLNYSVAVTAT